MTQPAAAGVPTEVLVVAGKDGASVSAPSPSTQAVLAPLPTAQRPQGPASAGVPCGPAQPAQLWPVLSRSGPRLGPAGAAHQASGQTDRREAQGGQSRAGGLPSGLPEQQDPSVSLAGLTGQVGASGGLKPRC